MTQTLQTKILKAISFLAHPVFVFPLLTLIYMGKGDLPSFFAVFLLSFIGPFCYFLYLYKNKKISNFDISERKQRYQVFYAALIGLLLSLAYLYFFSTSEIFWDFARLIGIAISLVVINFKTKVSIHTALITILCFSLVQDFGLSPFIFSLVPLIAYTRFHLKRHTPVQLILGALIPTLFYIWSF